MQVSVFILKSNENWMKFGFDMSRSEFTVFGMADLLDKVAQAIRYQCIFSHLQFFSDDTFVLNSCFVIQPN